VFNIVLDLSPEARDRKKLQYLGLTQHVPSRGCETEQ